MESHSNRIGKLHQNKNFYKFNDLLILLVCMSRKMRYVIQSSQFVESIYFQWRYYWIQPRKLRFKKMNPLNNVEDYFIKTRWGSESMYNF